MNLSTARSAGRAREVGVRKTIGASRFQLAGQFIGESVLLCLIALLVSIGLVKLLLPFVQDLSERELSLPLFANPWLLLLIAGGAIFIGILSGLYPAAYLSSFKPVKVLKGSVQVGKNKGLLRNILVVGQFTGAIFLIIATAFVLQQLRFMQEKDPGFTREQVMLIPLNYASVGKYESIKQELLGNTLVSAVTATQQRLGNNLHQTGVTLHGLGPARTIATSQIIVDADFLTLYNIKLVAGRNFSKDYAADNGKTYIINESMAKELLKEHPKAPMTTLLGKMYGLGGMDSSGKIIGISKDFNFNSLHHKIETLTIFNQKDWGFSEISVRINGSKAKEAIAFVEGIWKKQVPGQDFEYSFLDEHFNQLYKADAQVSKIVGALATLAIVIACLGLFGLAAYASEKRVKEIGIRKVLGASVQNIVGLLSRDFVKLVLISNIIAWPLAWLALSKWLQDFAYRVDITWWVFAAAGLAALLIALFTVSFQAIKAAIANPVNSLRSE
jgi:putative ABC transport system permease protein